MVFGYTSFDPIVVFIGTVLAIWYLKTNAPKLIGAMPTALSLWFFIPWFNNMALWQAIPLLLTLRTVLRGTLPIPKMAGPTLMVLVPFIAFSFLIAATVGADQTRALIRIVYYLSLFALLGFSYEMGKIPESHELLLKGLVVMGIIYASYGAYQIIAFYTGLPVRGIVYNSNGNGILAAIQGIPRVNSLANEPKRLGYVLFLSALACIFLAQIQPIGDLRKLRLASIGIIIISFMTFSNSYYFAIAFFGMGLLFLKPSKAIGKFIIIAALATLSILILPNSGVMQTIKDSYTSRMSEFDVGIDNAVVYRQEFFAWDYLEREPLATVFGVGVGQYFSVLRSTYGPGVGYGFSGELMPLNSNFLELVFDFGVIATLILYASLMLLIIKLRRSGELFYCYSILFLVCQSFTILTILFILLLTGLAMGKIAK